MSNSTIPQPPSVSIQYSNTCSADDHQCICGHYAWHITAAFLMFFALAGVWYFWRRQYEILRLDRDEYKSKFTDLRIREEQRNSELYFPSRSGSANSPPIHVRSEPVERSTKSILPRTLESSDDENVELTTEGFN